MDNESIDYSIETHRNRMKGASYKNILIAPDDEENQIKEQEEISEKKSSKKSDTVSKR